MIKDTYVPTSTGDGEFRYIPLTSSHQFTFEQFNARQNRLKNQHVKTLRNYITSSDDFTDDYYEFPYNGTKYYLVTKTKKPLVKFQENVQAFPSLVEPNWEKKQLELEAENQMLSERRELDVKHIDPEKAGLQDVFPEVNNERLHVTTAYEDTFIPKRHGQQVPWSHNPYIQILRNHLRKDRAFTPFIEKTWFGSINRV